MKKFFFASVIILGGCASAIPIPTEEDVFTARQHWNNTSIEQHRSDRQLNIDKCSGCHSIYHPSDFSEEKWIAILPEMNGKSKLTLEESEQIKRYLLLFSSRNSAKN